MIKHKRIIILAGGYIGKRKFYNKFFLSTDYIICVNGGLINTEKLNLKPDLIVGDIDSYNDNIQKFNCKVISFSKDKDKTDTELALEIAKDFSPEHVIILGGLGKRFDHSIGNLYLLLKGLELGFPITILDSHQQVDLIQNEIYINTGSIGTYISLIPVTQEVKIIKTSGLKYNLNNDTLYQGQTRGISNELISIPAFIKIQSGLMFVVKNNS